MIRNMNDSTATANGHLYTGGYQLSDDKPDTHTADIETVREALDCYRISALREVNEFALEYANNALAALDRLESDHGNA